MVAVITAGLLAWAVVMWQHGLATAGDMVLICSLGFTILHGTRDLAVALVDLTQHVSRLDEAISSLLTPHELPDAADAAHMQPGQGRVVFDQVYFAYPGREAVLQDLDLAIEPGQRVGLVGASGAGKSTVLALLQRFYDVQAGAVRIDGHDISTITQESLRETMAIVPQDISLFHRSVLENIRYARPDATEAEVMEAATIARCRDFIEDAAGRLQHHGRRPRRETLRRPAPAPGHRPRAAEGRADPAAGRSDLRARHGIRAGHPDGAGQPDARPHRDRHRPPPVHPAQFRPHRGDGCRARGG